MPRFPDRWFDYTNTGDVIQGTRLITFKVPLKESFFAYNRNISENSRFTPSTLIESLRDRGLNLGLVVDLTFTTRYYDPEEFTSNGVQYEKIFVEGHEIPKMEVIEKFYEVLDNFYKNSEEGSLVGVHCTHGVNRTGYVVCRYMVEHLGMTATEALEAYRIARGYPVERKNYINDLKRRAGEHVDKEDEEEEHKQKRDRHRSHNHRQEMGGNSYYQRGRGNTQQRHDGKGHYQNRGGKDKSGHQHFDHNAEQNGQYNDQGAYGYTEQQEYRNVHYNDQGPYGYTEEQEYWSGQYNDQGAYGYTRNQYGADTREYLEYASYDHNGRGNWRGGQQSYQDNRRDRHHWENNPGANGYDPRRGGGHSRGFHSYNSGSDSRPTRGAARGNRRQKRYRSRWSR